MQMDIPTHTDLAQLVNDNGMLGSVLRYRECTLFRGLLPQIKANVLYRRVSFFSRVPIIRHLCVHSKMLNQPKCAF